MPRTLISAFLALAITPALASAQAWQGRVLLGVNGAVQPASNTYEDDFTYQHPYSGNIPGEAASVSTRYDIPAGIVVDGGIAVRLFGNLGAGVSFSHWSDTDDMAISARIPHPFFVGRHREVQGTETARHAETGTHVQVLYIIPAGEHLYFGISGGPSYFNVEQQIIEAVNTTETYPYDTAEFASGDLQTLKQGGWGFNAGVDLGWMFTRNFGIGGLLRYSRATVSLEPSGRDARDIDAGGLQAGAGIRLAF